jgi:hypothetical protein
MADLVIVNSRRAVAIVEVEVQLTETIDTFISWPVMAGGVALDELGDLQITINSMNVWAAGGYYLTNFVQNAVTGRLSFDLTNITAGAPGNMGEFRIEVERVKR